MSKKLYCPSLWKSVHVDTNGDLTPCCLFVRAERKVKITEVKNIKSTLFKRFNKYRQQMENGEWPTGCEQCKFAEEAGHTSKRMQDEWILRSMATPPEEVSLEYLQLKTGRLCNLKCTICGPQCSTAIATEQLKENKITKIQYDTYQSEVAWSYDIGQFLKMNSDIGYAKIDIAGGEPLMNKTHFEWLDQLTNTQNTRLLYNTNGTFRPTQKEIDIWKKFKGICISFSIDSYGENFEKLRVGAKWDEVLSNLKYYQEELISNEFNISTSSCVVVVTVSRNNVNDLFELYRILTSSVNFTNNTPVNFNYLSYPEEMACHNMSKEELFKTLTIFSEELPKLPSDSLMYKQSLELKNSLEKIYVDLCKR